ncbi:MAG: hypothetical protein ACFE8A_15380 [Candidatus Hodarchaeota archaeon]
MSQILEKWENIVVEAIQDYLKENRVFDMEKIIPHLIYKFNKSKKIKINNEGIQKILLSLVKKSIIVEGTTFTKKDVLMNRKRKKIYDYIKENPGKYVNKIAKELKISNIVVFYHLDILVKFNFIKKTIIDNHVVYFDSNIDLRDINKLYFTSKEKSKRIINYLKINNCGIPRTKLAIDLKIHYSTLRKYIKPLEEFNIISKEKRSNKILYFLEENSIM